MLLQGSDRVDADAFIAHEDVAEAEDECLDGWFGDGEPRLAFSFRVSAFSLWNFDCGLSCFPTHRKKRDGAPNFQKVGGGFGLSQV